MIDEDRTYENEIRFYNDRLGVKKDRNNYKGNIPLDLESSNAPKNKKEKINGVCINYDYLFIS